MVRVVFLHPDLGIGGAERLIVDACLALQSKKHSVEVYTNHYDSNHCFSETIHQIRVTSIGDFLPRKLFGCFYAFFAYLRMLYLAIYTVLFISADVFIVDQVSVGIPILKYFSSSKIIFYCHFPDQLLSGKKAGWIKKLYRKPLDYIEEITTGVADIVLVNSYFTAKVYRETFKGIFKEPSILYPSINSKDFDELDVEEYSEITHPFFLSLNRFERKKNLNLAIEAFAQLYNSRQDKNIALVIAGGYDPQNEENIQHYKELSVLTQNLGLASNVKFCKSIDDKKKIILLKSALGLLYTPSNEHFGIVPIEAMYCKLPVIAVNSGGPLETISNELTGFLVEPNSHEFYKAMSRLLDGGESYRNKIGECGKQRVLSKFSFETFTNQLHNYVIS